MQLSTESVNYEIQVFSHSLENANYMISDNSSSGSYISVPATNDIPAPPAVQLPVSYYYFASLPGIITATTGLITAIAAMRLGRKQDKDKDEDDRDKN